MVGEYTSYLNHYVLLFAHVLKITQWCTLQRSEKDQYIQVELNLISVVGLVAIKYNYSDNSFTSKSVNIWSTPNYISNVALEDILEIMIGFDVDINFCILIHFQVLHQVKQ